MHPPNTKPAPVSLEQAIQQAGSPMKLLWKPHAKVWAMPVLPPEYIGWQKEQAASYETVSFSDLSFHMDDLFIEGPDALRLLKETGANSFESFADGQAKQFIPVTEQGFIVNDLVLMRHDANRYTATGVPTANNWLRYQAQKGGYDVTFELDPNMEHRPPGSNPRLFRYQVQGVRALEVLERCFGGPPPTPKFFHAAPVNLAGRNMKAFRHVMLGMPGYEIIGEWKDAEYVKEALLRAGEPSDMVRIGGLAYLSNGVESGWLPQPVQAIYTDAALEGFRQFTSVFSYEGQRPLNGSYFSENIEDYYFSPFEMGYGRLISTDHDFIGREALEKARHTVSRSKVTLVLNADDVRKHFGTDPDLMLTFGRHRVEAGGKLIGSTAYGAYIHPMRTLMALAVIDNTHVEPGTEVTVTWGQHPGFGAAPDAELGLPKLRATVHPAPFSENARTAYRRNA